MLRIDQVNFSCIAAYPVDTRGQKWVTDVQLSLRIHGRGNWRTILFQQPKFELIPKSFSSWRQLSPNWEGTLLNFSSTSEWSEALQTFGWTVKSPRTQLDILEDILIFIFYIHYLYSFFTFFRYKVEVSGKSLPILTNGDKGRFGVIVFENYTKYIQMDKWNKELLDKYCREYDVGIVGFMPSRDETYVGAHLKNTSLFIDTNVKLKVNRSLCGSTFSTAPILRESSVMREEWDLWEGKKLIGLNWGFGESGIVLVIWFWYFFQSGTDWHL